MSKCHHFKRFISLLFIAAKAYASDSPAIVSYKELGGYYEQITNNAIQRTQDSYLSFELDAEKKKASAIIPLPNPDFVNSLFNFDISLFLKNNNSQDFVTAKIDFYKNQGFNTNTQSFNRPYYYVADWMGLFHPPVQDITLKNEQYGSQFKELDPNSLNNSPLLKPELHKNLDELTQTEMTAGNKMQLLIDGKNSFKEKVRMVLEAKKYFFAVVMVQYCDQHDSQIVDAMIKRAQEGIDVRLIVEKVWTKAVLKKCLRKLRNGGVKVMLSHGFFRPKTMFTVMHDKFWIRDGEEAIIGGQNMHDFENGSNGFNQHTHDKDVHVQGPAVTDMLSEYTKLWNLFNNEEDPTLRPYLSYISKQKESEKNAGKRGSHLYTHWLSETATRTHGLCRVIVQGDQTDRSLISKAYLEIMSNTQKSMFINTPNLSFKEKKFDQVYNSMIIKKIIERANQGVKIDLVSNGKDGGFGEASFQIRELARRMKLKGKHFIAAELYVLDEFVSIFSGKLNHKTMKYLADIENIDTWEYFNHIHSKQMMFDKIMVSTGSFNLDSHSYKNHESTMICIDEDLAQQAMKGYISDIVNSVPVL